MKTNSLLPFLLLTFSVSWGIAAFLILFTDQAVALFGEINSSNPLYIFMAYSPGLAGVFMVWKHYGIQGLKKFFKRLLLWKMSKVWWFFLLVGIPILAYFASILNGTFTTSFPFSPWHEVFPAVIQSLFLLGTIEEFGWRGVAQPLLQQKMAPFWAGLVVGIIWATWHLPAFLFGGGVQYSAWPIIPFFAGVIALSIILTPMFNNSKGSLLIAYLFHFQMMNPIFPDAQPWDNLVFMFAAVVIVLLHRDTLFNKGSSVTSVVSS
jgi:membrane protease YdiL (CAAX protease family)